MCKALGDAIETEVGCCVGDQVVGGRVSIDKGDEVEIPPVQGKVMPWESMMAMQWDQMMVQLANGGVEGTTNTKIEDNSSVGNVFMCSVG